MSDFKNNLENIGINDAKILVHKSHTYGDSWRKRGGMGAFMMLARKWDRIENIARERHSYDLFEAWQANSGDIIDDIQDLRRYLMLVEEHMLSNEDL